MLDRIHQSNVGDDINIYIKPNTIIYNIYMIYKQVNLILGNIDFMFNPTNRKTMIIW